MRKLTRWLCAASIGVVPASAGADPFSFTIDPAQSNLLITITAQPPIGGPISDAKNSSVHGTIGADLLLPAYSFGTAQLTTMDASLDSPLHWTLSAGAFGAVNLTGTDITFNIPGANGTGVPGAAAPVALDGSFSQTGNLLEAHGILAYSGTGLFSSMSGNDDIGTDPPFAADFAGTIVQSGSTIRATVPIDVSRTYQFQNGGTTVPVTAHFAGQVSGTTTTVASGWKVDANGTLNVASNWSGGIPANTGAFTQAVFGPVITAPRTVTIPGGTTVGRIIIDSAQPYLFSGGPALGDVTQGLHVLEGAHTFTGAIGAISSTDLYVSPGASVRFAGGFTAKGVTLREGGEFAATTYRITNTMALVGSTARLDDSSKVAISRTTQLSMDLASTFDVGDEGVNITSSTSPTAGGLSVAQLIASGYAGGAWTGTGIVSRLAASDPSRGVGYAVSTTSHTWFGEGIPVGATMVMGTLNGDANLDRTVNFSDLLSLAQHYGAAGGWAEGDSTYDGVINFADLLKLAQNYGQTLSGSEVGAWASSQSVPEPSAVALAVAILLRRKRRS